MTCNNVVIPCLTIAEALERAEACDTIRLDLGVYFESITIDKDITIMGASDDFTAIDGEEINRVVTIAEGMTVTIAQVEITGGYTEADGGGIYNAGQFDLRRCVCCGQFR